MKTTMMAGAAALSVLALMGCRDRSQTTNGVGACNPANSGHDCIHLNGDGVHIARTTPRSASGIRAHRALPWHLLGFANVEGRVIASGWYDGIGPADGEVTAAVVRGEELALRAVLAPETALRVELADVHGAARSIDGDELADLVLTIAVPEPASDRTRDHDVRIVPKGTFASSSARSRPLARYAVEVRPSASEGAWASYCEGPDGEAMSATLFQGAQWTPDDGTRTEGDHLVTLTCETGAVAQCALWGYSPWGHAAREGGVEIEPLAEHHQACIHMKRGAYCGTDASFTREGTPIEVSDPFGIQGTSVTHVEAIWTADGAACLSTPRDPDSGFEGCPDALPPCPAVPGVGAYLVSGVPE